MTFSREWHALGREAELAAGQIGIGIAALGRANHAQKGLYTQAFFGLSIGFERMAKIILLADNAIDNNGQFLTDDELKKRGHDVGTLLKLCEPIADKYVARKHYGQRPSSNVHDGIVQTLTEFGKLSRYYNLDLLSGGRAARLPEPIGAWWQRVGLPILAKYYTPKQRLFDEANASVLDALAGEFTTVIHHDEMDGEIRDLKTLANRGQATRIVQTYGRLYTLQIVRWLAFLLSALSNLGAYEKRIEALLGLHEPFIIFMNEHRYLKSRKTWLTVG